MKWLSHKTLFFLLLTLCFAVVTAQQPSNYANQRKALELQRKELVKKINETKKVLEETRNKQNKSLADLKVIGQQIQNREKVINNVADEIAMLEKQIILQQAVINTLRDDLIRLKEEYGKSILGAYKQRNVYDKVMFIFSAQSFNQALKRIQYLNQLGDYRKHQAELILHTQTQIISELNELIAAKREKQGLIVLKEAEKKELEVDKKEESVVLQKLQQREKDLRRILAENEKAARKLNEAIGELIQKEIAAARKKEEDARKRDAAKANTGNTGKTKPNTSAPKPAATKAGELYLTPEALKLSNDFESNQNSLPWPVERGTITDKFGQHEHPTLKGVMVNNNGVDIETAKGANVRSVFKGTVKSIFSIPGMGKIVLINHGKYYTAYAKLATVNVKEGQEVDTREVIGTVLTNDEDETEVHFEIWKVQQKQNPELWLKK
jgi:septal ring factor EnvC (AmiA/AmiB activator)